MTDFKHIIQVLRDFFQVYEKNILEFNIKLTTRGQIGEASGTLSSGSIDILAIEKAYRKRLVANDYRFCNTKLIITTENTFVIEVG